MNILGKLHAIHAIHDSSMTTADITTEGCFSSYLRAVVGIENIAALSPMQILDYRADFTAHVNNLYAEHVKRNKAALSAASV
ncbi:hypothetical protein [Paraburkholderia fungorum]|uniref:hypothetical protein n=1 Tax=Paraburkholderia fungorum TaxID=134537 RepID=UPI002092ADDA|nr:hypothetical protein [Paraburkholderia fungorum]USU21343.1 hypothetical protein NFE55_30095 [Paraburkholderia fungorum]USU26661.1 hypothetical protein NFS19_31470 [Paraburkholderia fungorum]